MDLDDDKNSEVLSEMNEFISQNGNGKIFRVASQLVNGWRYQVYVRNGGKTCIYSAHKSFTGRVIFSDEKPECKSLVGGFNDVDLNSDSGKRVIAAVQDNYDGFVQVVRIERQLVNGFSYRIHIREGSQICIHRAYESFDGETFQFTSESERCY